MGRFVKIAIAGMLASAIAGCGGEEQTTAPSPSPSAVVTPSPSPTAKPFAAPPVVAQNPAATRPVSGLIRPTNAGERVKVVKRGRVDPFAGIIVQGVPASPTATGQVATTQKSVPALPNLPLAFAPQPITVRVGSPRPGAAGTNAAARARATTPQARATAARARATTARTRATAARTRATTAARARATAARQLARRRLLEQNARRIAIRNNIANARKKLNQPQRTATRLNRPIAIPARPAVVPILPPPPQPELAQAVNVTGVVQVGNEVKAIIQEPNVPFSRYVSVGQRLSNGQVLVKRIELNEGSDPVVVLEQFGIEVARAVGEKPGNQPGTTGTPTAAVPPPPPRNAIAPGV